MKKYILLFLFAFISAVATTTFIYNKDNDVNICNSDILWIKDNGTDDGIMLKSKTSVLVADDNTGRMNMYGYIKEN
ncbi:FidL-like protein, partial [Providencia stuartii]